MDGGSIAKNAYRYQDWCAMYFALEGFEQGSSFERIYCEQNKLDFEIWQTSSFIGFQVKTTIGSLTAKEINKIFLYYVAKSTGSGKTNKEFKFVFGENPVKSLAQLFIVIRDGNMGGRHGRRVQKFIDTSLNNIPVGKFLISYHNFDQNQIKNMVYAQATKILRINIGSGNDFNTKIVDNFISSFRDKIDEISCKPTDGERTFSNSEVGVFIKDFIATFQSQRLEKEGRRAIKIELPEDLSEGIEAHITMRPITRAISLKNTALDNSIPADSI